MFRPHGVIIRLAGRTNQRKDTCRLMAVRSHFLQYVNNYSFL